MNIRKLCGYAAAIIGLLLIAYGVYSKIHLSSAKTEIHQMTHSKNPIVQSVGKDMEQKVGRYGTKSVLCFFGGALFMLLGAYEILTHRKKNRK